MSDLDTFMKLAPVLEKDYPLFSWDDHPQSRDALVPGTPVEQFETNCWNSMVMKVYDAMDAMGITWEQPPYFYQDDSKYFTAAKCYSMYYMCRFFVPLAAYEYTFQYEIGNIARGEYLTVRHLTFLAEWLNKFLKLARGTDSFARIAVRQACAVHSEVDVSFVNSVPITSSSFGDTVSRTAMDVSLDWLRTTPATARYIGKSQTIAAMNAYRPEKPEIRQTAWSSAHVYPVGRTAVTGRTDMIGSSNVRADFAALPSVHQFQAGYSSKTSVKPVISMIELISLFTSAISATTTNIEIANVLPVGMNASAKGWSSSEAACEVEQMYTVKGAFNISRTKAAAELSFRELVAHAGADLMIRSLQNADMVVVKLLEAAASEISRSLYKASINTPSAVSEKAVANVYSKQSAEAVTQTSRPMWTNYSGSTTTSANCAVDTALVCNANSQSSTNKSCSIDIIRFAYVQENTKAFSTTKSEAIVWAQTTQPDSRTLRIRQTHRRPAKIGPVLYLDCWPDQGITDDGTLVLKKIYDTVVQVEETLYIGTTPE